MARRIVTDEEQQRLVAEVEELRKQGGGWDFAHPKQVSRGTNPTAVVSTRVPLLQFKRLSRIAADQRMTIAELVKDALESYVATAPLITLNQRVKSVRLYSTKPSSETLQPHAKRFVNTDTSTDSDRATA